MPVKMGSPCEGNKKQEEVEGYNVLVSSSQCIRRTMGCTLTTALCNVLRALQDSNRPSTFASETIPKLLAMSLRALPKLMLKHVVYPALNPFFDARDETVSVLGVLVSMAVARFFFL